MSRGKRILLMVIGLVIVIGLYYSISNKQTKQVEVDSSSENENIVLHNYEISGIDRLILKKEDKNIILVNNETPTIEGLPNVKLNINRLRNSFNIFANLTVNRLVEKDAEDLAKYGLDKSNVSITGIIEKQKTVIIHLGNKTMDGTSYFIRLNEDDNVYLLDANYGDYFMLDIEDFRDPTLPNIDKQLIRYLYIESKGNKPIEISYKNDSDNKKGIGLFSLTKPYNVPKEINYKVFDEIIKSIPIFSVEKYIDDKPSDLSVYGLDDPVLRLKLQSENQELDISKAVDILFGDTFDDYIYFKYADSDSVYGMRKDFAEYISSITPFDLVDKNIRMVNIKNIKKMEIGINDSIYTFNIDDAYIKDEKGVEQLKQTFYYEDKKLEDEVFRELYQLVIGISGDAEINQQDKDIIKDEVKIIYTFKDDTTETIIYTKYDDLSYLHELEDDIYFLCSTKQFELLYDKLKEITN
ncbi:DUF4340 domain-containing protein [Vallitalea guaymasensis]|uniref:DUF4340 domain-containing protein n=1 Tax=Vallitalea guaymasensis TaxID=1185412 RepID=UPI0023576280|nr:DUF4340 domain-containing protein [Vallitalea guaymasensis]